MKILGFLKISRGESLNRIYLFKLFGFGVFLHQIHGSDPMGIYHSHPWDGISIIFGKYEEEYGYAPGEYHLRRFFNWIYAPVHHRVRVEKPVWTLFMHGRKYNKWSIKDSEWNEVTAPWEGAEGKKSYSDAIK